MADSLSITIRRQLRRYLQGGQSLREFVRWLAPRLESLDRDRDADDLAHEAYLRIAEYTNGDWTEDELRAFFRPLVTTYVATWPSNAVTIQTGTSSAVSLTTQFPSTLVVERSPLVEAS